MHKSTLRPWWKLIVRKHRSTSCERYCDSPLIWRRLLVRSDSTVARLQEGLQIAFGWDDEHLNRFEIRGREYAVYRDGGGMIGIDARVVRLCGLIRGGAD
jgi:hypothetical protein